MGILDSLIGNTTQMNDRVIASDLLKDSKFGISTLALALTETTNPELRDILTSQLNDCIVDHHMLSDMAIKKDWYRAFASPQQQVNQEYQASQRIMD